MIAFYFDEMMPRATAKGLEEHGIDVVMAVDVGMIAKDDDTEHLVYSTENKRVLVTRDRPFAGRTTTQTEHGGLICWTGNRNDFGGQIRALIAFHEQNDWETVKGQVFWLSS